MKKLLLKSMLLLSALIVGSSSVWAGDVTSIINFGSASGSTKIEGKNGTSSPYTDSGNDSQGNTWTITTVTSNAKSFTQSTSYSQVGASSKPVTSITFTTTLPQSRTIKAFSAKFGGFSNTAGDITLKVGDTTVGTGELNAANDVTVSATNTTATGTVLTVTVTNIAKGVKCYYISYTYDDGTASSIVATPTISVETGTYTTAQNVTLACDTEGATIHYTMTVDGTTPDDPSESDATYSTAISVTKSGTKIKAKAFKDGMTASAVASATYTIKPSKPTITAAGATITITAGDGCNIYYTTDNTEPTTSSSHYTGSFNLNTSCKIKARAYDTYNNASDISPYDFYYWPLEPKNINSNYFVKVNDVSTLENGDAVLIVCESDNVAMSTTQNNNNRGQAEITITNNTIDNPSSNVQKLVLMKIGNYFYFYTGSGYLYAASGSSNYLKTEDTPDDNNNAKASIAISSGDATITFQGDNTHNIIKHNGSSSLFSCYLSSSDQDAIQIYKEVPREPADPTTSGDVTYLTTTDNMAGWRAFYDKDNSYSVDVNTTVYVADVDPDLVENKITLKAISGIPANVPVILHTSSSADSYKMTLTKKTSDPYTYTDDNNLIWTKSAVTDKYRLGYGASGVGFYPYSGTPASGAVILNVSSASGARELTIDIDDDVTGISTMHNSQCIMNNDFYNLAGQRVAQPTKGLYIVNGKKVVVK